MAGGHERILRALEELTAAELRRLKAALNRLPVAEGYWPIPRGRMEAADALDLTDLVVGHYGSGYGTQVAAAALRRIQRRDLAEELGGAPPSPADPPPDLPSPSQLFVTRHRLTLIQRVRAVAAILDHLQAGGVLATEEIDSVAAGATPQERMRRLLATAPAWGHRGHRIFLGALRRLHPALLEELEGGDEGV